MALVTHTAHAYAGMQSGARLLRGGLAPWQARRAQEMIAADLAGETPLAEVAAACGLSASHFARAFRKTTGLPPHAWLLQARVERAKALLRRAEGTIADVAQACGFADQSHLTRVFTHRVGLSPGAWRRLCRG